MESVCFHDSKLVNALTFHSFHVTEAPTVFLHLTCICGGTYWAIDE